MPREPKTYDGVHLASNGDYWQVWWYNGGMTKTGRTVRSIGSKREIGSRKADAMKIVRRIERQHDKNPALVGAGGPPTLSEWCDKYLDLRKDISEATALEHRKTMAYLRAHFGDGARLDAIGPAQADDWRAWLYDQPSHNGGSLSKATVAKHCRAARTIFARAVKRGHCVSNPFDGLAPRVAVDSICPDLTDDQVEDLVEAAQRGGMRCLVALCAYAGLRRGEALDLTWRDIRWEANKIIVRNHGREQTTKRRMRDVRLEPVLASILLDYHPQSKHDRICHDVPQHNMHLLMRKVMRHAGVEYRKPFHALRAWRSTTWKATYPEHVVDSWLGHSAEVARAHYNAVPEHYYTSEDKTVAMQREIERLRAELSRREQAAKADQKHMAECDLPNP